MINPICPECHGDIQEDMTEIKDRLNLKGIISEHCNPGGRALRFIDGSRLQLYEMCNACDKKKIEEFLKE
jgi:hypothetical protein